MTFSSSRLPLTASTLSLALLGLLAAPAAQAYKLDYLALLGSQSEFKAVAQDLSATLAYKPMAPAVDLGILGFDLGVSAAGTRIQSTDALKRASASNSVPSTLPTTTLHAVKGLPFGLDVGASYAVVPGSSIAATSGELKWSWVSGGVFTPAVSSRIFYTQMSGVDNMSLSSRGLDISVSKGFAVVTPYVGVGVVDSTASTRNRVWATEHYTQSRVFGGVNVNLLVLNLAVEGDRTGQDTTLGVKAGFRF